MSEAELAYLKYQGYKRSSEVTLQDLQDMRKILKKLETLDKDKLLKQANNLPSISLEEVKEETKKFYNKYFNVHDITWVSADVLEKQECRSDKDPVEVYQIIQTIAKKISPFDIPVKLIDDNALSGYLEKGIVKVQGLENLSNREVPLSIIALGDKMSKLSIAAYTHEIAHTQQESVIGYAEDFSNLEVISTFLEKLNLYDLEQTKNLLKLAERLRFCWLYNNSKVILPCYECRIEAMAFIYSTLQAQQLFDIYIRGTNHKKEEIIQGIQDVFDGKQTVEDLLAKQKITFNNSKDLKLVLRHMQ